MNSRHLIFLRPWPSLVEASLSWERDGASRDDLPEQGVSALDQRLVLAVSGYFRSSCDIVAKSFWDGERKFLEPLMRLRAATEGTISFHPKSITDLRGGVKKRSSSREVQRSTFARFVGLFDFRLLQHG
jgi:hypothetical protein